MKRIMAFLLALTVCLSLCACGQGGSEEKGQPTDSLEVRDHHYLENIYGDWEWTTEVGHALSPYDTFSVYEDGTCKANGRSGTWRVNEISNETHLWLDFYFDGAYEYCISYYIMNGKEWLDVGWTAGTFMSVGGFQRAE